VITHGHSLKLTDVVLYPQNGDRIVTTDSVTSLHPVYTIVNNYVHADDQVQRVYYRPTASVQNVRDGPV